MLSQSGQRRVIIRSVLQLLVYAEQQDINSEVTRSVTKLVHGHQRTPPRVGVRPVPCTNRATHMLWWWTSTTQNGSNHRDLLQN